MVPVIYTTYGMAMGHRPEVLAASGGVRLAEAERRPEPSARIGVARVCCWLGAVFAQSRLRHRDADSRTAGADGMSAAALPTSR
jgi:hypothetical protein